MQTRDIFVIPVIQSIKKLTDCPEFLNKTKLRAFFSFSDKKKELDGISSSVYGMVCYTFQNLISTFPKQSFHLNFVLTEDINFAI